ncbi:NAC domain-containing protein JA2-like [Corylus avellana]|uniref:NAC domain-containing protein JA2-like n=1 Tax=Corylus avellana TaxID=13451 RepID=UPI00286D5928|nr:NAC domain-containing protein JA2-like [Corylus avellana]
MGFETMPVGFRFHPTIEEIFMFLRMKVKGEALPHDEVGEFDIYGNREPWIIFDPTVKKQFFVFTKLKKKSKSRRDRVVGCSTWKNEHTQEVRDPKNNKLIGIKKSFVFKYTKNKAKGGSEDVVAKG